MIALASDVADKLEFGDAYEYMSYEGKSVHDVLRTFREEAVNAANERALRNKEVMRRPRTRSGRTTRNGWTGYEGGGNPSLKSQ